LPFASQFITIIAFRHYGPIGLVYSINDDDSIPEVAIQRMMEAAQRMIRVNNSQEEEQPEFTIDQLSSFFGNSTNGTD
jgi:hypothetical protein